MTAKDLKIQRIYHLTGSAFFVGVIAGGIYAYNQWKGSATAAAIERNAPKLLDQAGSVDTGEMEKAGLLGAFVGGALE